MTAAFPPLRFQSNNTKGFYGDFPLPTAGPADDGIPTAAPLFSFPSPHRISQPRYNLFIRRELLRDPAPAAFGGKKKKKKSSLLIHKTEGGMEGKQLGRIIGRFPASSMAALKQLWGLSNTRITARSWRLTVCSAGN